MVDQNGMITLNCTSFALNVTEDYLIDGVTLINGVTDSDEYTATTTQAPVLSPQQQGMVDDETRDLLIEIANCYLLPIVVLAGVAGNAMSFVVLLVHGMNNSTNVLLTALTISDFGYLVTLYTRKVSCIVSKFDPLLGVIIDTGLLPTVYMVNQIFGLTTPFLTMLITLERCLAVTMPLKIQTLVTSLKMKIAVTLTFLAAVIAQIPYFFLYKINWVTDETTGWETPRLAGTQFFYTNFDIITAYNNIVLTGLFVLGPMAIIVICTIIVLATVKKSARWRKVMSQGGDKTEERRMTKMLMTVVAVFIACNTPKCASKIANSLAPHTFNSLGGREKNLFYVYSAFDMLFLAFNSSINFVIYMLMSKKFFNIYRRVFLCQRKALSRERATLSGRASRASRALRTDTASKSDVVGKENLKHSDTEQKEGGIHKIG